MNVLDFMRGLGASVASNNPVTMAVDTGANIADLGIAAAGYLGHKTGMLTADQLPEPLDKSKIPGSTAWLEKQAGVNDSTAATAGTLAGMFVNPGKAAKGLIQRGSVIYPDFERRKKLAEKMLEGNATKEEVWKQTGLYKARGGTWLGEVSDVGTSFKNLDKVKPNTPHKLRDVADLPQLQHIDPKLRDAILGDTKVVFVSGPKQKEKILGGSTAMWDPNKKTIYVQKDDPEILSNFLHELQHSVSTKLGGFKGGSPEAFRKFDADNLAKARKDVAIHDWAANVASSKGLEQEMQIERWMADNPDFATDIKAIAAEAKKLDFLTPKEIKETLSEIRAGLREADRMVRPAIQNTRGGIFNGDIPFAVYANLADEAFARAVQARRGLNQAEVFASPFWEKSQMDAIGAAHIRDPDLLYYNREDLFNVHPDLQHTVFQEELQRLK